jgi:hypothetical protein
MRAGEDCMAFFVSGALRYPGAFAVAWKFALYIYRFAMY